MGGAAWFGLGLISGSKLVFSLAVIKHLGHWWFVSSVEKYVACLARLACITYQLVLTQPAHDEVLW